MLESIVMVSQTLFICSCSQANIIHDCARVACFDCCFVYYVLSHALFLKWAYCIFRTTAMDHFGSFVLSGNTCSRNRKLGQTWRSVIQMLFKIHKCFGHLIDKFARFRHETIVKMENMSREEKFKAMKLPELKA